VSKNIKVKFSSPIEGLFDIPELQPQPAINFIPDTWKKLPSIHQSEDRKHIPFKYQSNLKVFATAKQCPSFLNVFEQGYVLVSPCDMYIKYDIDNNLEVVEVAIDGVNLTYHFNHQYIDYIKNTGFQKVYKLDNVFLCETPKGYSIKQLPMYWHHNPNFEVAYGIIHTDQYHQINPQIMMREGVKEMLIKQGEPLCYIVPYKRIETELVIEEYDSKRENIARFRNLGTFQRGYSNLFKKLNS